MQTLIRRIVIEIMKERHGAGRRTLQEWENWLGTNMIDEVFVEQIKAALRDRREALQAWLGAEAPYVAADQKHLDVNTPERAYWHYGYQVALADVLALMEKGESPGTP